MKLIQFLKYNLFLIIWILLFKPCANAQETIVYSGKAIYECMFESSWKAVLYYNATDKYFVDIPGAPTKDTSYVIDGNHHTIGGYTPDTLEEYIWASSRRKKLYHRKSVVAKKTLVEEPLEYCKWKIKSDKIKIMGSMSCQMATTRFRGRNYELWFCPQIPVNQGPWKFNNLPGLAVSIKSTDGEVAFLLQENKIMKNPKPSKYIHFKDEIIDRKEEKKRDQADYDEAMRMVMKDNTKEMTITIKIEKQNTIEKE